MNTSKPNEFIWQRNYPVEGASGKACSRSMLNVSLHIIFLTEQIAHPNIGSLSFLQWSTEW